MCIIKGVFQCSGANGARSRGIWLGRSVCRLERCAENTGMCLGLSHSVRNQASRIPPNPEIIAPTVQTCSYML